MQAREAIRKAPVTVTSGCTITDAAALMNSGGVGALLVIDDDHLAGIVTDRDIVVRGVAQRVPFDARIDSLMTTDVITIEGSSDVRDAYAIFRTNAIRRLPVLQDGAVIGMIAVDDLFMGLAGDLADLARPVTGEVVFGHRTVPTPA